MTVRTPLAALALTALLASGCDQPAEPTAAASPTPSAAAPSPSDPTPSPEPSAVPRAASTGTALLTDVRVAHREGFDRVTFEFSGALPRYDIRYADGAVLDPAGGDELEVGGEAVLMVRLEPASSFDVGAATPSYDGPARLAGDTTNVVEVVRASDFEAVLEWAVGVRTTGGYEVTALDAPPRLVLDVTAD